MKYHVLRKLGRDQGGLVALDQLQSEFSRTTMRTLISNGILLEVRPSIFALPGATEGWRCDLRALLMATPDATASHLTAMRLWDLIAEDERDTHIEVTVPAGRSRKQTGVRFHETDTPSRLRFVDGMRVTNPARTLIDVACNIPLSRLENTLELALQLRLTTFASVRNEMRTLSAHGRNGVGVIREVLDAYDPQDPRAATALEREVRAALRAAGLPDPVRQHPVPIPGRKPRYLDMAYPAIRLGIEAHSRTWHTRLKDFDRDALRDGELTEAGWTIIYVTKANLEESIARIARIFSRRQEMKN